MARKTLNIGFKNAQIPFMYCWLVSCSNLKSDLHIDLKSDLTLGSFCQLCTKGPKSRYPYYLNFWDLTPRPTISNTFFETWLEAQSVLIQATSTHNQSSFVSEVFHRRGQTYTIKTSLKIDDCTVFAAYLQILKQSTLSAYFRSFGAC